MSSEVECKLIPQSGSDRPRSARRRRGRPRASRSEGIGRAAITANNLTPAIDSPLSTSRCVPIYRKCRLADLAPFTFSPMILVAHSTSHAVWTRCLNQASRDLRLAVNLLHWPGHRASCRIETMGRC